MVMACGNRPCLLFAAGHLLLASFMLVCRPEACTLSPAPGPVLMAAMQLPSHRGVPVHAGRDDVPCGPFSARCMQPTVTRTSGSGFAAPSAAMQWGGAR